MSTKLTLTIEKEIIEIAKKYAKETGQSVSEIVENYLKFLTRSRREMSPSELSPRVQRLRGIIKTNKRINYKSDLSDEIAKEYEG